MSELLNAALAFAACGLHVLPCKPQAEIPACPHGSHDATTDRELIARWWHANPLYNVAIACGPASGLFVIDIDGDEAEAGLRKLEAQHGELPQTWETITPRGR